MNAISKPTLDNTITLDSGDDMKVTAFLSRVYLEHWSNGVFFRTRAGS